MSDKETCRYPSCDNERRERGEEEYPDSDGDYKVSRFGAKFCSVHCELKYEKRRDEAREARADQEQSGVDKRDLPEYDGPPY